MASALPDGTWRIGENCELRICAPDSVVTTATLVEGTAEMLGVEMLRDRPVVMPPGVMRPVFSFHGGVVRIHPAASSEGAYVSDESTFPALAAVNARLEARRAIARGTVGGLPAESEASASAGSTPPASRGPVVLVAGPTDSGKSTTVSTLAAWACRRGWSPTVVDLDPGQGEMSAPCAVAAAPVDRLGLSDSGGLRTHALPVLAFPVGTTDLGAAQDVFRASVTALSEAVRARAEADEPAGRSAGTIINTCGWVEGGGLSLLLFAARAFAADVILVVNDDALVARLTREAPSLAPASPGSMPTAVVKLPVSGGVRRRSQAARLAARKARIREYFYGALSAAEGAASALTPNTGALPFDAVRLVRVGGAKTAAHQLPIGAESQLSALRVEPVELSADHEGCLLALSAATTPAQASTAPIAGFAVIHSVNEEKRTLMLMRPTAQRLPKPAILILTSERYADE